MKGESKKQCDDILEVEWYGAENERSSDLRQRKDLRVF
jgi:hypothetical protein